MRWTRSGWAAGASYDRRYARVKRPVVLTGGELTLDQLDLQYDSTPRCTRPRSR